MTNAQSPRGRKRARNSVTTKSGNTIKVNQTFGDRHRARKLARAAERATYLSTLPKDRWKRLLYRLHPQRVAAFWFSREGAIMGLKIIGVGIVVCFFLTIGLFAYFRKDLPKIKDISGDKLGGSITYYDRTGQVVLWQDYNAVKRIPVTSDNISPYLKNATVAIEDKDFYKHGAFDVRGIMRAGLHDIVGGGGSVQGGSTITQQLVKLNEQWTNNRTVTRKVKELILAVELEREYSKNDILTGYLNVAPYGGVEYGAETAARDYFHTSAKDLTLAQASMLAAIPQSPSYYSPYGSTKWNTSASDTFNQTALLNRQHYILDQMTKQGYITQAQANAAKQVDVLSQVQPLQSKYDGIRAPYFVLAAKQQLEQKYGADTVQRGGWSIITTLDLHLQDTAEQLVAKNLPNVKRFGGDEEATVMEDVPTGQIVALVGGTNFSDPDHGQVNYANQVLIPPGSSFKPYDYSTLINNSNAGAGSVLYDTQGPLKDPATGAGYPCTDKALPPPKGTGNCLWDYDFKYPGPLTLRYALAGSRNVPAVKAMIQAGVSKTISTASAMMDNPYYQQKHQNTYNCYQDEMLTKIGTCYPAAAIGDGAYLHLDDHVNGLATLGRLGAAIPRTYILKITDAGGKVIDQWKQPQAKQVIKPDTAYIVDDMLSDPNASYLTPSYKFQHQPNGWHFAVKTGTTNDNFDGLMTSWSTKYAVVSWVGYHTRNHAMTGGHMEQMTEPLTRGLMEAAHQNLKPNNWVKPAGVKSAPAYVVRTGLGSGAIVPSPSTDLFPSWYQSRGGNTAQTIDKVSGKLATSCTPDGAKETVGNANTNSFSIDQFVNGGSAAASGTSVTESDDVHNCDDTKPSITLTAPPTCSNTDNNGQGCTITATVSQGTHPLGGSGFGGTVDISINGTVVKTFTVSDSPSTVTYSYVPTSSGTVNVSATVTDSVLYTASDSATMTTQTVTAPTSQQDQTTTTTTQNHTGGRGGGGGNLLKVP